MNRLARGLLASAAVIVLAAAGCGGDGEKPRLTVSAATSLKTAFERYGETFTDADVRFSFAGSDELAAQIRQGAKPDVFAAANTKVPNELFEAGLVERPVVFATNRLLVAVPADRPGVRSFRELERPGVKLVIGAASVPIGSYTREVLQRLGKQRARRILANVRSNEPNVGGIVGKLTQGAADAGFVYVTDVTAAGGELGAIELPSDLQPEVEYAIAVLGKSKHPDHARAFVAGLAARDGRNTLRRAGFDPRP